MDVKPELQKTIKRLVSQKNFDVLKAKLRNWISTKEVNVVDLLRQCREKTIFIPATILNKIGMLFSTGKEGITLDTETAFMFYLLAADAGHASANGNIATFYFNGRAPTGRNLDLAYLYCRKAIELGCDKFILMSEILHEKQDYTETIRYIRQIMDKSSYAKTLDVKKKIDIRKLEINCLHQELITQFVAIFSNHHKMLFLENILLQQDQSLHYFSYNREKNAALSPEKNNNGGNNTAKEGLYYPDTMMRMVSQDDDEPLIEAFDTHLLIESPVSSPLIPGNNYANSAGLSFNTERSKSPAVTPKRRVDVTTFDLSANEAKRNGISVTIPPAPTVTPNSSGLSPLLLKTASKSPRVANSGPGLKPSALMSPRGMSGSGTTSVIKTNNSLSMSITLPTAATTSGQGVSTPSIQKTLSFRESTNNNTRASNNAVAPINYHHLRIAQYHTHHLPGWYYISDELEGFDSNACLHLSAKVEMITLESEIMKTAIESAQTYMHHQLPLKNPSLFHPSDFPSIITTTAANNNNNNQQKEIYTQTTNILQQHPLTQTQSNNHYYNKNYLQTSLINKLNDYQLQYQQLQIMKQQILHLWNYYSNISEHILRRQLLTEKKFFNSVRNKNNITFLLSKQLLHYRLYDYEEYLTSNNVYHHVFLTPNELLNENLPLLNFTNRYYSSPYFRLLLVAERSLLELSIGVYGRGQNVQHKASPAQRTGWTGGLNQYVSDLEDILNNIENNHITTNATVSNNSNPSSNTMNPSNNPSPPTLPSQLTSSITSLGLPGFDSAPVTASSNGQQKVDPSLREHLLQETTYLETVLLGSAAIRVTHKTYPMLTEPAQPSQSYNTSTRVPSLRGNHQSFVIIEDLNHSKQVLQFLNKITMVSSPAAILAVAENYDYHYLENERKVVDIILRLTSEGKPINLADLQSINEECTENDVNYLMKVVYYYFMKRLIPWILSLPSSLSSEDVDEGGSDSANEKKRARGESFQTRVARELPLATAQARALTLVRHGFLTFQELFEVTSPYGIFYFDNTLPTLSDDDEGNGAVTPGKKKGAKKLKKTSSSNNLRDSTTSLGGGEDNSGPATTSVFQTFDLLRQQIININEFYQKAILEASPDNLHPYLQFWKNHPQGKSIPTYKQCKAELVACYGGDGDSDGEEDEKKTPVSSGGDRTGQHITLTMAALSKLKRSENNDVYGSEDQELEQVLNQLKV
eukprot:gene7097-7664_t